MKTILVICGVMFGVWLSAANYYVSPTGDDANVGSLSSPFLSLAKASSMLQAGDTCFIMAGVYRETLETKNAGTSNNPIVYTNYADDEVVISATVPLSNWQVHDGNVYKANYTMSLGRLNTLFCNDAAMDLARWPNNEDNDPYTFDAYDQVSGGSASTIVTSRVPGTWTGAYVCYLGAHSGMSWTRPITASTSGLITFEAVNIEKWPFDPHNPTVFRNDNRGRFFLMGTLEALDYEREWFYDAGVVYFQAPGDVDPNTLKLEVRERETAIKINKSYNQVIGLDAFGGNVEISADYCLLSHCELEEGWRGLDRLDNTSAQVAEAVVEITSSHVVVDHNVIDGSSLNGIVTQGWGGKTNLTISNNIIRNCNTTGIHASPIRNGATNSKMIGNTIYTTGRDGMYSSATGCEIAYNDVYDVMRINNDGGVYYTVGNENDKNVQIHHNWFHDSEGPDYADGRCAGIYLDNNSKGYVVHHNVVWNITWSGIQLNWDNWNIDIFNNTLYDMAEGMGRWENGYTLDDVVLKNNYASIEPFIGTYIHNSSNISLSRKPFVSVEDKDFRPYEGSYIVDNGVVIAGITDGYQGDKPDIGAYELGLTPWRPGVDPVVGGEIASGLESGTTLDLDLYPNPLQHGDLNIQMRSNSGTVEVYNARGQQLYTQSIDQGKHQIARRIFPSPGLYLVQVKADGVSESFKVLVE